MPEAPSALLETSLAGLSWPDWVQSAGKLASESGSAENLGPHHAALFVAQGKTLLVSFEAHHRIGDVSENGHPLGWKLAAALGWSHLCLASETDTWFRDARVYGYFDRLIDEGFFEAFDQVIFYGAGPCGYAAAAFSVASPGARVLAIQPQASLDPRVAEWDDRFLWMRRTAFDDRYGYAPDMLDAAEQCFLLYDPEIEFDAMHAALFTRGNVTKFRMRFMGERLEVSLMRMKILLRLLAQSSAGRLDRLGLARLYRARRGHLPYLKQVLTRLEDDGRLHLNARLCNHVIRTTPGPRFRRSLRAAYKKAEALNVPMPPPEME